MKQSFAAINDWNTFYDRLSLMGTEKTNWKVAIDKNSRLTTKKFLYVTANGENYQFDRKNKTFKRSEA